MRGTNTSNQNNNKTYQRRVLDLHGQRVLPRQPQQLAPHRHGQPVQRGVRQSAVLERLAEQQPRLLGPGAGLMKTENGTILTANQHYDWPIFKRRRAGEGSTFRGGVLPTRA